MKNHPIIFVDDDKHYLDLVESIVKQTGINAHYVTSGDDALEILKENPCEIMFTDLHMPEIDGFLLSKRAQEIVPGIEIVMVTSAASAYLCRLAATVGISKVIDKPQDYQQFKEILQCIVDPIFPRTV